MTRRTAISRAAVLQLTAAIAAATVMLYLTQASGAAVATELYTAVALVTGQGEENRAAGFATALKDVLVKVSGDATLVDDPAVGDIARSAADYVAAFSYRDRMADIPVHDEQGTRDRPYELTVGFAPERIDDALRRLGRSPWAGPRPTIAVFTAIDNGTRAYILTRDGAHGRDLRAALTVAAERAGLSTVLPDEAAIDGGAPQPVDPTLLQRIARSTGGDIVVVATLMWSDAELGWIAEWMFTNGAGSHAWSARGVSFDGAFLNGMRGVAQILSGNGSPD